MGMKSNRVLALEVWCSPNGTGTGTLPSSPKTFNQQTFSSTLNGNPGETEFIFRLLPSALDYQLTAAIAFEDSLPGTRLGQLKVTIQGEGESSDAVRLVNRAPLINGAFPWLDPVLSLGAERPSGISTIAPITAERLIVRNLLIDGGWAWKMQQIGAPALGMGYKNSPLNLLARTGSVRGVIVREFGAIGLVPWSHIHGASGVEAFPFVVGGYDAGQVPPPNFLRPWEVVDCEVHGFNGAYAGYTTMLMVHAMSHADYTPAWIIDDPNRRFAYVSNVRFRSATDGAFHIAMGNAGGSHGSPETGRTTFRDNVVLNTSLGYNGDTGRIRSVDILNSMGLNVWWWMNSASQPVGWHSDFLIANNSIRFGPRAAYPSFRAFCWSGPGVGYTDPSLIIGRPEVNDVFAGVQVGAIDRLRIENNFFTTIPQGRFDQSGSTPVPLEVRLLRRHPAVNAPSCSSSPGSFNNGNTLVLGANYLSGAAQDFFTDGQLLMAQPSTHAVFSDTNPVDAQSPKPVLANMSLGTEFNFGRIIRVHPVTTEVNMTHSWKTSATTTGDYTFPNKTLVGTLEVSLGQPQVGSGSITFPARVMLHKTSLQPSEWGDGKRIWVQASGLATWTGDAVCDPIGETSFSIPVDTSLNGELFVRAFHDPNATTGPAGQFSEYKVAYATGVIPVGQVVSVKASVSVAVDRRELGVQEGRLLFKRTATSGPPLTINFTLGGAGSIRPASPGSDFTLQAVGEAVLGGSGSARTLKFPTGAATAEVRVIPLADEVVEQEHVWVTVASGSGYAPSSQEGATGIYIYDGPRWTLHEITHTADPFTGITRAQAVSSHANGTTPTPLVGADMLVRRTGPNSPGGYTVTTTGHVGAQWSGPFASPSFQFEPSLAPPHAPVVTGVNDLPQQTYSGYLTRPSGADRAVKMWMGSPSGYLTSWDYLPIPTTGAWLVEKSRALCISPNGAFIGGYATRSQSNPTAEERMAVFWTPNGMSSLFSEATLNAARGGEAAAVNSQGEFVGHRQLLNSSGVYIPRGFRTEANGASVATGNYLQPPEQPEVANPIDVPSKPLAISAREVGRSGLAAGWARRKVSSSYWQQPSIWWHRYDGQPEPANTSWAKMPANPYKTGQINAISQGTALYGWVGDSAGANRKAWRWPKGWEDGASLEDKFLVFGFSAAWSLQEFTAASDKEVIVGNGVKNGAALGFVLMPQAVQP